MNDGQKLFWEACRPLWLYKSEKTGKMAAMCKFRFEFWLSGKIGMQRRIDIFDHITDSEIGRAIPFVEPLILRLGDWKPNDFRDKYNKG